jgi:hypothetical protein
VRRVELDIGGTEANQLRDLVTKDSDDVGEKMLEARIGGWGTLRRPEIHEQAGARQRQFVGLAGYDGESDGTTGAVGDHAGFGAIAAARAPQPLTAVTLGCGAPFRAAPAAFWCARMLVPSRNVIPSSMP